MEHHFYQTCAYFTTAKYIRTMEKLAIQVFEPTKMKPAYAYIMMYLEDHNPATIMEISRELGYERSTVSRMTKTLIEQGLLTANLQGRQTQLQLTDNGLIFLKTANRCLDRLKRLTDSILGEDKLKMTRLLVNNNQKIKDWFEDDKV
jgi:DNA-binding MarR family transcriptional regulator